MGDPVLEALDAKETSDPVLGVLDQVPDTPEVVDRKKKNAEFEKSRVEDLRRNAINSSGMTPQAFDALPPEEKSKRLNDIVRRREETSGPIPESAGARIGRTIVAPAAKAVGSGVATAAKETGELAKDVFRPVAAVSNLVVGDTKQALESLQHGKRYFRAPSPEAGRLERALSNTAEEAPGDLLTMAAPEMVAFKRAGILKPIGEAEKASLKGSFERMREERGGVLRRTRETKQIERTMKADEGERLKGVFGLRKPPQGPAQRIIRPGEGAPSNDPLVTGDLPVTPAEKGPAQSIPLGPGPMTRLGHAESEYNQYRQVAEAKLGQEVYLDGKPVRIIAHRPDQSANVLHPDGSKEFGVPYTSMRPTKEGAPVHFHQEPVTAPVLDDVPRETTPALKGATEGVSTPPKGGALAPPTPPTRALDATEAAVDADTGGLVSWLRTQAKGVYEGTREAFARTKYHAAGAGPERERYLAALDDAMGKAGDVTIPLERKVAKAGGLTEDEGIGLWEYASGRAEKMPDTVAAKAGAEIGNAIDYLNTTLRPELQKSGGLSEDALAEFDRWLPNVLTAELEKTPPVRVIKGTTTPRGPRLRSNYPGVTVTGAGKEDLRAIVDAMGIPAEEVPIVGNYGKGSFAKFTTVETRDAFLKQLEATRGQKTGVRYKTFEQIPDEYLIAEKGLSRDPMALIEKAIVDTSKQVAVRKFYDDLAPFARPGVEEGGALPGYSQLPDTPRWGALRGKQVPDELRAALTEFEIQGKKNPVAAILDGTMRAFKTNAVIKFATGARNFYNDAVQYSMANGITPGSPAWFRVIKNGIGSHVDWFRSGKRPDLVRRFQEGGGLLTGHDLKLPALEAMQSQFDDARKGVIPLEQAVENAVNLSTGSPFALQKGKQGILKRTARAAAGGAAGATRGVLMGEDAVSVATRAATGAGVSGVGGEIAPLGAGLYNRTDDVFKIGWFAEHADAIAKSKASGVVSAIENLTKQGLTRQQAIDRLAAQSVNDFSQVFSMKAPVTEGLSRSGIVPFASFYENRIRIAKNLAQQGHYGRLIAMEGVGTMEKVIGGAAVVASTGIPAAELWDWYKNHPTQAPYWAEKVKNPDGGEEWKVYGADAYYLNNDIPSLVHGMVTKPGGTMQDVLSTHPAVPLAAKMAGLSAKGTSAENPFFGEGSKVAGKGEPTGAAAYRTWTDTVGSAVGPVGRQTEGAMDTAPLVLSPENRAKLPPVLQGKPFKSNFEERSPTREALSTFGGIRTTTSTPSQERAYAQMDYKKAVTEAEDYMARAMGDKNLQGLPPTDERKARVIRIYEGMKIDAYEEALDRGLLVGEPSASTEGGRGRLERLRPIAKALAEKNRGR